MLRGKFVPAAVLFLLFPASGQSQAPLKIESFRLDNGLRVVLAEDHAAPTYAICVVYNVGSRDERPGKTGFAHLFEHMMFQGSENVGKGEHFILIQNNGGGMNGTTNVDRTNYFQTLPSNQLDLGLFLEADRMRSLDISQENLENQRQTVKEERRLRYDNAPYGRTFEVLNETAYENYGYQHSTIGSMEDLDAATLDDVRDFFTKYYAPNNAVVTLVGDFDTKEALAKVEQYFGDIPPQPEPFELLVTEPQQKAEKRATVRDRLAKVPRLDIAYQAPPGNMNDWYILAVMMDILGGGRSSRLYQRLVEQEQVAVNVSGWITERRGPSLIQISATPRPGTDLAELERFIYDEIEKLQTDPPEDWEMETIRMQMERRQAKGMQSTLGRAVAIAENTLFYRDPNLINTTSEKFQRVTKGLVRRAAELFLTEQRRTVVTTIPSPEGDSGRRGPGGGER
jgi:predicted Zn-dependent peptidase